MIIQLYLQKVTLSWSMYNVAITFESRSLATHQTEKRTEMEDNDGRRQGLVVFICIMITSFFVFAFLNGVIHLMGSPGIGAQAFLELSQSVIMPLLLVVP